MAKRPPLGGSAPPAKPAVHAAPLETTPERTGRAKSRQGKLQFAGYLDATFKRELDVFAAREGRSLQSIFEEMHDMFAERYGLHRITGTH
jgi:hypothetical protein